MARFTGKLLRMALALIVCSGCAADGRGPLARMMPWRRPAAADPGATDASSAVASDKPGQTASPSDAAAPGDQTPPTGPAAPPAADPAAMFAVLSQLKGIGAIDQATQDRLFEDLQKTDPSLWPQMLDVFRASLAYRQKYVEQPAAEQAQVAAGPRRMKLQTPPADPASEAAIASDLPPRTPGKSASKLAAPDDGSRVGGVQLASTETVVTPAGTATDNAGPANTQPPGPAATAGLAAENASPTGSERAAAPAEPQRLDWREHLQAAIQGLENETADPPATTAAIGRHAGLRLLYVVDGRRDAALKPIVGIPPTQQDFWSKELFALTTYLDSDRNADENRRAAAASIPLREAAAKLGELATLSVRNLAFCNEVSSYGVFKKFPKYEFQAGQEVLLYAEVENFKTLQNEKGFHTALKSSYEILDSHGARVDQKEFEITAEDCQNARRDYFIRYFVWMPKRIYGGSYTLQLTIEDTHSQKIGQSSIDFTIHEKDN